MIVATTSDIVTVLKEGLLDLADAFDVSESQLWNHERREGMELFRHCTGSQFAQIFPLNRIEQWLSTLEDDLHLYVHITDNDQLVEVRTASGRAKLEQIYKKIAKTKVDHIEIRVEISKTRLTQSLSRVVGTTINAVYFFAETLSSRLTLARVQALFDSDILSSSNHGVVGILFCSGLLQSKYLTVVGLENFDPDHFLPLPSPSRYQAKWDQIRLMRDANMTWADSLRTISPHYFQVKTKQLGIEQIEERLIGLSEILSIFQFCLSIISRSNGTIIAQISRPGGTTLEVDPYAFIAAPTQVPSNLGSPVFQVFKWAFQGEDYDKIDIVRDLIDHEVRGREGDVLAHLMLFGPELLISARANYKALRERALETYWKARQEAKDKVDMYVVTVRSSVDKLRTDMLARAIQFFTAIVAFLAVGVFQHDLPIWIKISGLLFSVIYIALIGLFQLWPAWIDYGRLLVEAGEAVDEYNLLSSSEREHIKAKLTGGQNRGFEFWLVMCASVYGIEFVVFIVMLVIFIAGA